MLTPISTLIPGHAKLSNVEFSQFGHYGFTDDNDPRFAATFLSLGDVMSDPGAISYVHNCSFHHGYNGGIGAFASDSLLVENNVLFNTVGSGR